MYYSLGNLKLFQDFKWDSILSMYVSCHKQQVSLMFLILGKVALSVWYPVCNTWHQRNNMIPIPFLHSNNSIEYCWKEGHSDEIEIFLTFYYLFSLDIALLRTLRIDKENLIRQVMNDVYLFWLMTLLIICNDMKWQNNKKQNKNWG